MSDTIFHLDNNGKLSESKETSYISEDLLQQLLADYPNLISGSQINSFRPRRWLLISREFRIPDDIDVQGRWSLDHLFLDQDGIPTLIEVKRSTDTRIRREVIGQILDYASNAVVYWSIDEIINRFEKQCESLNKISDDVLQGFLQDENDVDTFWELTKTNLKAGKIRMLIVADTIPKELQRIIEFLNEQMTPAEILGVEIKQFVGENNIKTLVPRVIGQTAGADSVKGVAIKSQNSHWTEETFFEELLEKRGRKEFDVIQKLKNWLIQICYRFWYGSGKRGSCVPVFEHKGMDYFPFAIWTTGTIEIYFQWHKHKAPFDNEEKRIELLNRLNQIKDVDIPLTKVSGRPDIPISVLFDGKEYQKFIEAYDWFFDEIRKV
ncbi:hypothetical protein LJC68_05860 [Bacteroidales bacterium OttesenSCG-928-B11]|nr:hypothetical protein [Bacteroidales bacterium OttesenSCG-928-C03]MDL2312383.1 hypothetical protein [Bacteroidales bacterium OttesenSCG-928-B11]MDL2326639.1 hypothetical protein [Bacteroidales bacterium OttesenSCG-928-A14]